MARRFRHDCRGCQFLGQSGRYDVYQCDHVDLCLRFGDKEEESKSLPISIVKSLWAHHAEKSDWDEAFRLYCECYGFPMEESDTAHGSSWR